MTSNELKYTQQVRFDGGIQIQPELAQPNQVIDASNYWTPLSRCDRRPGVSTQIGNSLAIAGTGTPFNAGVLFVNGVSHSSGAINVSIGDIITPASYSGDPVTTGLIFWYMRHAWTSLPANTDVIIAPQFYTARGWVGVNTSGVNSLGPSLKGNMITGAGASAFSVVPPQDTQADPTTGGYWRFVITGLYNTSTKTFSSSGSAGSVTVSTSWGITDFTTTNIGLMSNCFRAQYAAGVGIINAYFQTTGISTYDLVLGVGYSFNDNTSLQDVGFNFNGTIPFSGLPASCAVLPEWNTAYVAVQNAVYEVPYNNPPVAAVVNNDPLIVGATNINAATTSIYPSDQIAQLSSFPAANLIVYYKDRLWAAGILGAPSLIRWGGAASTINGPAYNVWPVASKAQLSTANDNTPITAIATLADNLIVFKKNSIWQMRDNGTDPNTGLALYEPWLVVSGVGCLAHNSVKAVPGGLIFLAEDGFYLFDGTPNVRRISDPVKTYIARINPARAPFAQAVNWRTQQCYFCAVSLDGEQNSNNYVFVYDYQSNAWWIWTGWDVQCWYQNDGVGLREEIWFLDRYGRASKVGAGDTDNGTPITSFLTTHRFGEFEILSRDVREIRTQSCNQADILAVPSIDVLTDDILTTEGSSHAVTYPLDAETLFSSQPAFPVAMCGERRRERKTPVRVLGKWFQVTVHNALQVIMAAAGYSPDSRR